MAEKHALLQKMALGGMYDQLGGGYSSLQPRMQTWLVPHFEKMLYDNAQLLDLLALAQAEHPDPLYRGRAEQTVGWMLRDMTADTAAGRAAFAASEDADSEGVEGKFYVWRPAEVIAVLGPDAEAFMAAYDVTEAGNWEGHSILRRITPVGDPAAEQRLAAAGERLLAVRATRVRPGRDDKVLADWNGLAVATLCRAGSVFERPDWVARAEVAFDFILDQLGAPDGRVQHAWRLGRVSAAGLLDDQAAMARAALALFEATGNAVRLQQAERLAEAALQWFADADGSYFSTASDATDVPLGPSGRPRSVADNATPNGNGMMAEILARLHHLTGDPVWRQRTNAVLAAFSGLGDSLSAAPTLLAAADLLEEGACVVVTAGPGADALLRAASTSPDPAVAVLRAPVTVNLPANHPAFGKPTDPRFAMAYLCRGGTCSLPITDAAELARRLRRRREPAPA